MENAGYPVNVNELFAPVRETKKIIGQPVPSAEKAIDRPEVSALEESAWILTKQA
jgi:hypothetical protein